MFTEARRWALSWPGFVQSTSSHIVKVHLNIILLCTSTCPLPPCFPVRLSHVPVLATCTIIPTCDFVSLVKESGHVIWTTFLYLRNVFVSGLQLCSGKLLISGHSDAKMSVWIRFLRDCRKFWVQYFCSSCVFCLLYFSNFLSIFSRAPFACIFPVRRKLIFCHCN